jgi:DnaK suppressor protein
LENQRHALLSLRASLRGIAEASLAGSAETTSASPDSADLASEIIEQDVAVSLLGNAADTLDQIESALQRIEDGCYGRCAECQTRIPSARLEAIPYATCCVECASRRERAA